MVAVGDRWGADGPPESAYSVVTRDLGAVTAGFADYLDVLPGILTTTFVCEVRELDPEQARRLEEASRTPPAPACAVVPARADASPLLVGHLVHDGSVNAVVGFGSVVAELVEVCFCDACDTDSADMVEKTQDWVAVVTGGFHEFRRPHLSRPGSLLGSPRLEEGWSSPVGGATWASARVRGAPFARDWVAWDRRDAR